MTNNAEMEAARQRMIANRFGGKAPSHGKGAARRKKKVKSKNSSAQSDAKLTNTINKLGATHIPGIEEVNLFKEDGNVIHFKNPKVQASISANTYVISGPNQTKPLQEMLPGIVNQLGMEGMDMQALQQQAGGFSGMPGMGAVPEGEEDDDDDDDVPDLVEGNFEEVSEK